MAYAKLNLIEFACDTEIGEARDKRIMEQLVMQLQENLV